MIKKEDNQRQMEGKKRELELGYKEKVGFFLYFLNMG
jgi:hypothetical protein